MSGVSRPGSSAGGRPDALRTALSTPRTARTARPVSSTSGRFVRLGTASMLSQPDGPFINMARLNVGKYASRPNIAKALFEYILYHENRVREAMDLAAQGNDNIIIKFRVDKNYIFESILLPIDIDQNYFLGITSFKVRGLVLEGCTW